MIHNCSCNLPAQDSAETALLISGARVQAEILITELLICTAEWEAWLQEGWSGPLEIGVGICLEVKKEGSWMKAKTPLQLSILRKDVGWFK